MDLTVSMISESGVPSSEIIEATAEICEQPVMHQVAHAFLVMARNDYISEKVLLE